MKIRKRWKLYTEGAKVEKTVRAHTKSEARAYFKKVVRCRDRLPLGSRVKKVPV